MKFKLFERLACVLVVSMGVTGLKRVIFSTRLKILHPRTNG